MNAIRNRHFKETHLLIENQFIKMINAAQKKISIRDICNCCNINRSTFYEHFESIDELMDTVMLHLFGGVFETINPLDMRDGDHPISLELFRSIIDIIYENRAVFSYCVANTNYVHMQKNTDYLIKDILRPEIKKYIDLPEEDLQYYYAFLSSGFLSVITRWIENGCSESTEYISLILFRAMPLIKQQ